MKNATPRDNVRQTSVCRKRSSKDFSSSDDKLKFVGYLPQESLDEWDHNR
jgi:hypothetical protein